MYIEDEKYKAILTSFGYTEDQIEEVLLFRKESHHCTFEQFAELIKNKTVERILKLKKPRNIYVKDGLFYYLNHHHKKFNICGKFAD